MVFTFSKPHPMEEDECSNLDVASVIGKQAVESIVDFYGAPTKKKKSNESDDEEDSGTEEIDDYPEEEEDNLLDLSDTDEKYGKRLLLERHLKDQEECPDEIVTKCDENGELERVSILAPLRNYQKQIARSFVAVHPEAKGSFFDHNNTSEWEANKMVKLRKKLAREKQKRDEYLKIGNKKIRAMCERGRFKKVEGIESHVYIDTYKPPKALEIVESALSNLELQDKTMELTLGDSVSGDAEMDIDSIEGSDTETPAQDESTANNIAAESIRDSTIGRNLSYMDPTVPDLTVKEIEDDDAMSTASDLDFPVSDELKELQKRMKMPNEILRILYGPLDEETTLETKEVVAKENGVEEEMFEEDENGTLEEQETEDEDENELNNNNEKDTLNLGDASSTTGSILSDIQNTVSVATDQHAPPPSAVQQPSGQHIENKIILGCVGIPREQLPNVRIVWVPTREIVEQYRQLDDHLYRMSHAPDGTRLMSNEQLLRSLMETTPTLNNST